MAKKKANLPAGKAGTPSKKASKKASKKPAKKAIKKKPAAKPGRKKKEKPKKRKHFLTDSKTIAKVNLNRVKSEPRSRTTRISFNHKEKKTLIRSNGKKTKSRIVQPYLYFNGNCEEAFNFYKGIFGGRFSYMGKYHEMPSTGEQTIGKESRGKIMHISYPIGKDAVLQGADVIPEFGGKANVGTNFAVSLDVPSIGDAKRLFRALSYQGVITFPQENTFWGAFYGMCIDKFSVHWMISFDTTGS
jgi:PhnB protein